MNEENTKTITKPDKFESRITKACPSDKCSFLENKCPQEKGVCLQPLLENNVVVHYPWFANTYTLPFFYSKCLKKRDKTENEISNLIRYCDWGDTTCNEILKKINTRNEIHLFYSCDISKSEIEKEKSLNKTNVWTFDVTETEGDSEENTKNVGITLTKNATNDKYFLKRVEFCRYYPRFIFFDFSVDILQKLYDEEKISKYNSVANFLTEHFLNIIPDFDIKDKKVIDFITDNKIKEIQIFSDTPNVAKRLSVLIEIDLRSINRKDITIKVVDNKSLADLKIRDTAGVFNIYFYSASYNILFLKKKYQYLPFQLQLKSSSQFKEFDTACYLISKTPFSDDKLKERLEKFFQYIFWKAKETPEHFYEITQSFNFISAVRQPAVIFENEYCFAKCLSLFINPEKIKNDPKGEENVSKRLIFDALFNNSYGKKYEDSKKQLLHNVKQVYSLIALNYLTNNIEKIHLHEDKSFASVCEALQNTIFNFGFYNKVLEHFIEYEIRKFIKKSLNKNDNQHIPNPIYDAMKNYEIDKKKIYRRLLYEVKYHLNQVLIKECHAEDVFLATKKDRFDLEDLFNQAIKVLCRKIHGLKVNEHEAAFKHLKGILDTTLEKCATYYDDIVELDHFDLASTFRNSTVKKLLKSKVEMTSSIYEKVEVKLSLKSISNERR
ncbi:MAG: hypothetical protein LBI15_00395 [Dysgonamonadaceae bacterium]|jgi:hypothetical protein|nr:hypothetical protein [Dysgonamonadaceae bacterium]